MATGRALIVLSLLSVLPRALPAQDNTTQLSVQWSPERNKEESGQVEKILGSTADAVYLLLHQVYWLGNGGTAPQLGRYCLEKLSLPGLTSSARTEVTFEKPHNEWLVACFRLGDRIAMVTRREEGKQRIAILRQWNGTDLQPVGGEQQLGSWTSYSMYTNPSFTVQSSPNGSKFLLWTYYFKNKDREDGGQLCSVYDDQGKLMYSAEAPRDLYSGSSSWGSRTGSLVGQEQNDANLVLTDAGSVHMLSSKIGPPPDYKLGTVQHITFSAADPALSFTDLPAPPKGEVRKFRIFLSGEQQTPTIAQLFYENESKRLRAVSLTTPGAPAGSSEILFTDERVALPPVRLPEKKVTLDGYGLIIQDGAIGIDPIYGGNEYYGDAIILQVHASAAPVQTVVKLPLFEVPQPKIGQEAAMRAAMPAMITTPRMKRWIGGGAGSAVVLFNDDCEQRRTVEPGKENEVNTFGQKNACLIAARVQPDGSYGYAELGVPVAERPCLFLAEKAAQVAPGLVLITMEDVRSMDSQFGKDLYHLGLVKL